MILGLCFIQFYLKYLLLEVTAEEQSNTGHTAGIHERNGQNLGETSYSSVQRGLPTPGSLADVMLTTRHILNEQAAECLLVRANL